MTADNPPIIVDDESVSRGQMKLAQNIRQTQAENQNRVMSKGELKKRRGM